MDPTSSKQDKQHENGRDAIELLPESLQQLCRSGQSVQDLAHLIKNTIQMVSGSVEIIDLMLQRKQYDRIERTWDIFEPNFIRLKKFVLDLIKYTKHYPIQKTECDVNGIVRSAIRSCEYLLKHKPVKIRLQEDKAIRPIPLDADRIEELVANLITHALDNLPEHAGTISIETQYLKDHHQIQVSVRDDGPALPDETIRSLAEPCERTRNMCGTGFDIPLAKIYAEQHDGYMEFESTPGNCIRVYLPMQPADH